MGRKLGPSLWSGAPDRFVHVAAGWVAPDVPPLSPVRSRPGNDKHADDLSADRRKFFPRNTIADTSEFSQRPSLPPREIPRDGRRGQGPSQVPLRYPLRTSPACP